METEPEMLTLSEKTSFSAGVDSIREVFKLQRQRFYDLLGSLPSSSWDEQSRCSEWSVHQVVRHVRDVVKIHNANLQGGPQPFEEHGPFDPTSAPSKWLSESSDESPQETMREMASLLKAEEILFASFGRREDDRLLPGPLRRELHWSVASLHILWDAWMHERDISVPLGLEVQLTREEMRLMAMYGLLCAAAPAAWSGDYVEACLILDGAPDIAYRISHQDDNVYVATDSIRPEGLRGPADQVLDSLAGRGPELSTLFGTSGEIVDKLSLLRVVAT